MKATRVTTTLQPLSLPLSLGGQAAAAAPAAPTAAAAGGRKGKQAKQQQQQQQAGQARQRGSGLLQGLPGTGAGAMGPAGKAAARQKQQQQQQQQGGAAAAAGLASAGKAPAASRSAGGRGRQGGAAAAAAAAGRALGVAEGGAGEPAADMRALLSRMQRQAGDSQGRQAAGGACASQLTGGEDSDEDEEGEQLAQLQVGGLGELTGGGPVAWPMPQKGRWVGCGGAQPSLLRVQGVGFGSALGSATTVSCRAPHLPPTAAGWCMPSGCQAERLDYRPGLPSPTPWPPHPSFEQCRRSW